MAREPLDEYKYYVSGIEMTGMMTPTMAARIGAVLVDDPSPAATQHENNEANRLSTQSRDASLEGVTTKARTPRNKRTD